MNLQKIVMAGLVVTSIIFGSSGKNVTIAQPNPITVKLTQNPLSASDRQFITKAAQDSTAEIELGQLASEQAVKAQVREFGQMMVQDHTQMNNELQTLAAQKGLTVPQDIGEENRKVKANLSKLTGAAFDKAYMNQMIADHSKDVSLFRRQSQQANDPDLKAWAAKTLPTLQEHLRLARAITGKPATPSR
jgi:putative membrane protein